MKKIFVISLLISMVYILCAQPKYLRKGDSVFKLPPPEFAFIADSTLTNSEISEIDTAESVVVIKHGTRFFFPRSLFFFEKYEKRYRYTKTGKEISTQELPIVIRPLFQYCTILVILIALIGSYKIFTIAQREYRKGTSDVSAKIKRDLWIVRGVILLVGLFIKGFQGSSPTDLFLTMTSEYAIGLGIVELFAWRIRRMKKKYEKPTHFLHVGGGGMIEVIG